MVAQFTMGIAVGAIMTRVVEWPVLRFRDRIIPQRVNDIGSPASESKPNIEALQIG